MERPVSFFAMLFILLIVALGFILVVFDLRGLIFVFELGLLLSFMFILTFAMFFVFHNKSTSWAIVGAVLILLLFNVFIISLLTRTFGFAYMTTSLFAVIGLIIALVNLILIPRNEVEAVADEKVYYYPYMPKVEALEIKKAEAKVETQMMAPQPVTLPGKFLASQKSSKYHIAKCIWANNIKQENRLWFNTREEAESKGLTAHACEVQPEPVK